MKKYLSSYKLGDSPERLFGLFGENKKIAYISNALDSMDFDRKELRDAGEMKDLRDLGFDVEQINLQSFFGKKEDLNKKVSGFGGVYITGGNIFILRQACKLSGFDEILIEYEKNNPDFIYSGYSAGICILSPSFKGLEIVDDVNLKPYTELQETIWEGLGILSYSIAPHYDSDHPESADIDRTIQYFIENKILFKALRDGEVIISNN